MRFLLLAIPLAALLATQPSNVRAAISVEITPAVSTIRSDGPIGIDVRLDTDSSELVEGWLELRAIDPNSRRLIGRYRTGDLAFTLGGQRFKVTLPHWDVHGDLSLLRIQAFFHSGEDLVELGIFELRVPTFKRRTFVVGICHSDSLPLGNDERQFVDSLRIEQFHSDEALKSELSSIPVRVEPEELSANALSYLSFDMLIITAEALPQLKSRQLAAIAEWVDAGGSLCVSVGDLLGEHHVQFLNRMLGRHSESPFLIDDEGHPYGGPPATAGRPFAEARPGVSRVLVLVEPFELGDALGNKDWIRAAASLWKIREDQINFILANGVWNFDPPKPSSNAPWETVYAFRHMPIATPGSVRSLLLPRQVEALPFWVIAVILVTFVLAIAPGEYFLLGAIGGRRFTWIVFVATALGFTWVTARVAHYYMGANDYRESLVFVDVNDEGRPVRASRFELVFTAAEKDLTTEYSNAIHASIGDAVLLEGERRRERSPETIPQYTGNIPARFSVSQHLQKWTPTLSRQTQIADESPAEPFPLDWASVDVSSLKTQEGRADLDRRIREADASATGLLFHKNVLFDLRLGESSGAQTATARTKLGGSIQDLIEAICVRHSNRLFQIVSQIAPNGADNFEDLTLVDTSDESQWLLAIITKRGSDRIVYRKLYYESP